MAIPAAQGGISSPGGRRGILLAIVLMVVVVAYLYVVQSARSQVPDHGDFWTDMAHILAVRNINQYGFSPLCFGVTRDNGPEIGLPPAYYTHHPSFPMLVLSLFSRLGFSSTGARIGP